MTWTGRLAYSLTTIIHTVEVRFKINRGYRTAILSISLVAPSLAATRIRNGPSLREVTGTSVSA
jgi:hypothetical protein